MTSYAGTDTADVDPVYGIQLHHPRLLDFIGAPESARLLNRSLAYWVQTIDWEDAVAAALRLQHDAGLMTSNLQFVTSLNSMSSEVLRLAIGPEVFPSAAVDVLSPVPRTPRPAPLTTCLLWDYGGLRVAQVIPGLCRSHLVIAV